MNNPRAYAKVSFMRSYDKILGWDWGAAAKAHGQMLDRVEWVELGMNMYDQWAVPNDTRVVVKTIIKHMGDQIRTDHIGLIGRRRTPDGAESYPKYGALPVGFDVAEVQDDPIAEADELAYRLELLFKHLTPTQLEMVGRFIEMVAPTIRELAADLGYTPNYVTKVFTKIRATAERVGV
ncbi:hypothetical protein LCGC14_2236020 [marine sediment metagenome]|uniref:Uncharacterized protein n=1 Tax=marine sediment metagenome TaxID=412755 RepID=A0A0F9DUE4_9ZZZZ